MLPLKPPHDDNGLNIRGGSTIDRETFPVFDSLIKPSVKLQLPIHFNYRTHYPSEVKRALNETKGGKAPGMNGVRVEMLKERGVTVLDWLVRLFNICFMLSVVPVDWVIACMVPLYKGKGDMYECSNFKGISLLSVVGKVYGRVLINRIRDKTENVVLGEVEDVQIRFLLLGRYARSI